MNKKTRIRLFYYFVLGVLEAEKNNIPDHVIVEVIKDEIASIKRMKEEN